MATATATTSPIPPGQEADPRWPWYIVGLDLGQAQDYSALCVVERTFETDPDDPGRRQSAYGVRHLRRWQLGTPYTAVVADLADLAVRKPLPGSPLVVDATGVGRPVIELIRAADLPLWVSPVVIHGGHELGSGPDGSAHVPKKDLVGVMQTLVQFRRFRISPALPDAKVLGRELQQFRVKVSLLTGTETFEAWREREHDDLVLSVALACWFGERHGPFDPPAPIPNPPRRDPFRGRGNGSAYQRLAERMKRGRGY
jgi:hypothetical protein